MDLRTRVMQSCRWPGQRWLATRALRGKSQAEIAALIRSHMPKDVLAQQAKVAAADALAFVAPIHFCSFPSILKGWIDRVWTLDFAFGLTSAGWHGDVNGRIPLLHHKRVLIMTSTIFDKNAYDAGIRDAIGKVIDDWGFRFPGIQDVEHVYFYAATCRHRRTRSASTSTRPTTSARHSSVTRVRHRHDRPALPTTARRGRSHEHESRIRNRPPWWESSRRSAKVREA